MPTRCRERVRNKKVFNLIINFDFRLSTGPQFLALVPPPELWSVFFRFPHYTCGSELSKTFIADVNLIYQKWPCRCSSVDRCVDLHKAFEPFVDIPFDHRHVRISKHSELDGDSWSDEIRLLSLVSPHLQQNRSLNLIIPENRRVTVTRASLLWDLIENGGIPTQVHRNKPLWIETKVGMVSCDIETQDFLEQKMALIRQIVSAKWSSQCDQMGIDRLCKSLLQASLTIELFNPKLCHAIRIDATSLDQRGVSAVYNYTRICSILRTFKCKMEVF